jgi:hypothetical protein
MHIEHHVAPNPFNPNFKKMGPTYLGPTRNISLSLKLNQKYKELVRLKNI